MPEENPNIMRFSRDRLMTRYWYLDTSPPDEEAWRYVLRKTAEEALGSMGSASNSYSRMMEWKVQQFFRHSPW
jgi:hypothetical protein